MNEIGADCLAVKFGKQQGWLTYQGLQQVKQSLMNTGGSWTHLPGPQRAQLLPVLENKLSAAVFLTV